MRSDHLAKHVKTHSDGKKSGSGSDSETGLEQKPQIDLKPSEGESGELN
jgi:hypothetical protein